MEPLTALNAGPVRVVIAEGQGLLRAGFLLLLEGQDGIVVAAETPTLEEGVAATQATDADVVLIALDLPGGGGVEAAPDHRRPPGQRCDPHRHAHD